MNHVENDPEAGHAQKKASYPISADVFTTLQQTVAFDPVPPGLHPMELLKVAQYEKFGYGKWKVGVPLPAELRTDLLPPGHSIPSKLTRKMLLRFFAMTDIHITDKESPSQLIYLQQLNSRGAQVTSIYSPVMLYTTQVLDAAVQTMNALHRQIPFDFGLSLGDVCNSTQFNETRWYIDVLDGNNITPCSGACTGADSIDYQKPYRAAGLDRAIPWYQVLGNHDHFWIGSLPVNDFLRRSCVSDTVLAMGDVLSNPKNLARPDYYMGFLDGSTPYGDIVAAGPVGNHHTPPKVAPDQDRRSLSKGEWMKEFFSTRSAPKGHGFDLVEPGHEEGFACYSFVPKADVPIKVIVLDDTRRDDDGSDDIHGHGHLDADRYAWLKRELAAGDAAGQLMIIAAHVPIGVMPSRSQMEWWESPLNAVTLPELLEELHGHPNLLLWVAGHRHLNTIKAFVSPDPANAPEKGFWQVETSSLRDFPQQFRTFDI
ncbi:MAG: TIGR03768 family metallophosphoesterase [Methanomassiliicoccales archaeon]